VIRANPNLTQGQVAARLKLNGKKVNRAIRLLPILNPEARALITANSSNSTDSEGSITANGSNQNKAKRAFLRLQLPIWPT
jgi:hypothetical protein